MSIGSRFKRIYWPLIQHPALRQAACFHATATSEIEDIRRLGFRQPIALLPIGVDMPEYSCRNNRESKVILYLGRIHPEKGITNLLKAWRLVQSKRMDWNLRIVGPDVIGYQGTLEQQVKQTGIERVVFGSARYGLEKYVEYQDASIYVLPSQTENFGVSVAEALASGTPVIANQGAPWQSLIDEGCGWWVPHGVPPLAQALLTATALSTAQRKKMGAAGRAYVEQTLGWNAISTQMLSVYEWLIRRGKRPDCVDYLK